MSLISLQGEVSRLHGDGQYLQAIELITYEIKENPENPELFLLRAQNLLKLQKFKEASGDAARAIELGGSAEAHLVHGKALFNLGQYHESLDTFNKGKIKAGSGFGSFDQFGQWTAWCEERIRKLGPGDNIHSDTGKEASESTMEKSGVPANTVPAPKVKHDWYQTETHVIITILIKNLKKEDVKVYFSEKAVSVTAPLPSGSDYTLAMDVCHPINPSESSFRVVPSKIEVKMKKVDGIRWTSLRGDGTTPTVKANLTGVSMIEKAPSYPSSAAKKHDWSKIEAEVKKEEEDEKLEGDAALNQLFQKIYGQGSDETRRAMNKSFMESGGTVLSTNWKDVANQKVDVKPPDGMEFKKWEQ